MSVETSFDGPIQTLKFLKGGVMSALLSSAGNVSVFINSGGRESFFLLF